MIEKKSKILKDDEIKVILVDHKNQSLGLEDKILKAEGWRSQVFKDEWIVTEIN